MKKELIVTGKTVEEARKKAAAQLGVAEEEMIVTVLEEGKKGFLGIGASDAKISVSYSEDGEDTALDFIRKLIDDMALEGLTVAKKEGSNDDVLITVDGDNAGVLIGHHGETLEAIQYLANLAANKKVAGEKREYVRVTVDVEGYRAKRQASLRALARRMSAKVIKNKKSVMLEPMNPTSAASFTPRCRASRACRPTPSARRITAAWSFSWMTRKRQPGTTRTLTID